MANKLFNLKLEWHGPKNKKTQDPIRLSHTYCMGKLIINNEGWVSYGKGGSNYSIITDVKNLIYQV